MHGTFETAPFDKKDLNHILELWKEQYDKDYIDKRLQLFQWISEDNPFIKNNAPYHVLLDGNRIIGMHGSMPLQFSIRGKEQESCFAHDALLLKEYRGKGLGKILLNGIFDETGILTGALWFNEPNYRLYIKSGWLDIPNLSSYVKIYDPSFFLKDKIKIPLLKSTISLFLKIFLKIRDLIIFKRRPSFINIVSIKKFDRDFDILFNEISKNYDIMVVRNSQYLNWKFVDKPFNNYKKFAAYDSIGNLIGYMVTKIEKIDSSKRGRIIDFLVNPDSPDVFIEMINFSCKLMRNERVEYIQVITSSPVFAKLLKKCGFIKAPKPIRFMVKNWQDQFESNFISNVQNWYITDSDGDGDAWSIDTSHNVKGS